jgi:hypothetical protein
MFVASIVLACPGYSRGLSAGDGSVQELLPCVISELTDDDTGFKKDVSFCSPRKHKGTKASEFSAIVGTIRKPRSDIPTKKSRYLKFGEFPQAEVTDESLHELLLESVINDNDDRNIVSHEGKKYVYSFYEFENGKGVNGKFYEIEPIRWKILNSWSSSGVGNDGLFLLSNKVLCKLPIMDEPNAYSNLSWEYTDARKWLNNIVPESLLDVANKSDNFDFEGAHIFDNTKYTNGFESLVADAYDPGYYRRGFLNFAFSAAQRAKLGDANELGDKVSLLSLGDYVNSSYGFANINQPDSSRMFGYAAYTGFTPDNEAAIMNLATTTFIKNANKVSVITAWKGESGGDEGVGGMDSTNYNILNFIQPAIKIKDSNMFIMPEFFGTASFTGFYKIDSTEDYLVRFHDSNIEISLEGSTIKLKNVKNGDTLRVVSGELLDEPLESYYAYSDTIGNGESEVDLSKVSGFDSNHKFIAWVERPLSEGIINSSNLIKKGFSGLNATDGDEEFSEDVTVDNPKTGGINTQVISLTIICSLCALTFLMNRKTGMGPESDDDEQKRKAKRSKPSGKHFY